MPRPNLRSVARRSPLGDLLIHSRYSRRLSPHFALNAFPPLRLAVAAPFVQSRGLVIPNFFGGRPKEKPKTIPGLETLNGLITRLDTNTGRMPTRNELVYAFNQVVRAHDDIPDEHAYILLRCYKFLRSEYPDCCGPRIDTGAGQVSVDDAQDETDQAEKAYISISTQKTVLTVTQGGTTNQIALARLVFYEMINRNDYDFSIVHLHLHSFVKALCNAGAAQEAADLCRSHATKFISKGNLKMLRDAWNNVLEGFVKLDDEKALLDTVRYLQESNIGLGAGLYHHHLIALYCGRNDLATAKVWYEKMLAEGFDPFLPTHDVILRACVRNNNLEWGNHIVQKTLHESEGSHTVPEALHESTGMLGRPAWDMVLGYTVTIGKSIDDVDALLKLMVSRFESGVSSARPTVDTINTLVKIPLSQGNMYMAERLLMLLKTWGFEPNFETYMLQIEYRVLAGDLTGAVSIFEEMRFFTEPPRKRSNASTIQRLLRSLCAQVPPDMRTIAAVYNTLRDWNVQVEPETLVAAINVFLEDTSFNDVTTLLNRHVGFLTPSEQDRVIDNMMEYIQRSTTSAEAAWDTYRIMHSTFPKMGRSRRQTLMNTFFEIGKPDMAVRVLAHMKDLHLTKYQYTAAFIGLAEARHLQGLLSVHRQMNVDANVEIDTMLLNSLMYAYARCGMTAKAFNVYTDIARSPEGPDEHTINTILAVCAQIPNEGLLKAKEVWYEYNKLGVKLTEDNYASYLECLASHGDYEHARGVVHGIAARTGQNAGPKIISVLYVTTPSSLRPRLESYLEEHHANVWGSVKDTVNKELREANEKEKAYRAEDFVAAEERQTPREERSWWQRMMGSGR